MTNFEGIYEDWIPLNPAIDLEYHGAKLLAGLSDEPPPGMALSLGMTLTFEYKGINYMEYIPLNDTRPFYVKLHSLLMRLNWQDNQAFEIWAKDIANHEAISNLVVTELVQEPSAPNYLYVQWQFFGHSCSACYWPDASRADKRNRL